MVREKSSVELITDFFYNFMDVPVTFFREKIVEPNQQKYPWYHQKYRRVPTVDQCYTDDRVCIFEADEQFRRDRLVDSEICDLLKQRYEDCAIYQGVVDRERCQPLLDAYETATGAWFSKYGDVGVNPNSRNALMKQKHRMVWERRHGPIGSKPRESGPYPYRWFEFDPNCNRGQRVPDSIKPTPTKNEK
ncbi:NADH dehydrogenase [ubiquinone] 1 beta subcomplex subunit 10 [Leptopilina heterotoma]|uniref:NADH dehydrogenase [ubiquinone] 1 beta subcomplex subunit 10 n=1 Tax=Leptopilina heterotoma TaxID=63436 RepID=UPI001CA84198|nr:NADH dehydrogenase [ubiquinone] 1 beta subcomplex subunit 10 [Leptopilina heterotoma]